MKRDWNVPVKTVDRGVVEVKVGPCVDRNEAAEHAKIAFGKGASVDIKAIKRIDPVQAGNEVVPEPEPVEEVPFTDFTKPKEDNSAAAK